MIRLGIDAYGGDTGEIEVCKAVINSLGKNYDIKYILYGNVDTLTSVFDELKFDYKNNSIDIIDCKDKILMNDHPVFAIRSKTDSSITKAGTQLKNNEIDVFISAGNTGALVALAEFYSKPISGIDRPVIASIVPTSKGPMILADSGCNLDSKPEWLYQYAKITSVYYEIMFGVKNPRVATLSVGTEENKGNVLSLAAYKLISEDKSINFIGNVEARDLVNGVTDIVVTDGFAGNVFLKTYEGTATLLLKLIKEQIKSSFISTIGGLLIKSSIKKLLTKYNIKTYGGAPILGANHIIFKCHGNAEHEEYENSIREAYEFCKKDVLSKIKQSLGV